MPAQTPSPQNQTPQPKPSGPTPHQQTSLKQAQSGPDLPPGATSSNPSGSYGSGQRGRPRSTAKVRINEGVEEHRHPGADYWHPATRQHGKRGMSDQEKRQATERMHMAAGLGKDGRGGDTVQRTEMGTGWKDKLDDWGDRRKAGMAEIGQDHPLAAKVARNTGAAAAIAGVALAKGLAMNAADLTDKAFSGIRNAVNACMSPNPLSAAGSIMVDSLVKASDTSKRMMDIQRRYGIGNPDGQSLESTIAGRMMLKDQQIVKEGSQRALANISDMMERTGASDVNHMDVKQLQSFANENVLRMEDIMRRLDEDSAQPSSKRMSKAERQGLIEELRVHRDMNSQIAGRSKDIRSDAKEMAARIGHQRQYLNQMASIQRKEDRARLAQEAQARFDAMPAWGQEISRQVGARIHLDADGVPTNPAKRTAARRVLETELDKAERELKALQNTKAGDPARADELRRRIDSMNEGLKAIGDVDTREKEARERLRAEQKAKADEERRRAKEQGIIDKRRELARASDFTDPDFNPSEYIMRRTGVYDSDRGLDPHLVPQGAFNNPKIRQNLQSTNLQWEQWAREQGIDLTQDPRYISSKNTETAMSAKDHMDHVTKQLDHIATMSDDDLEKYFPGASRERLEEDLRKVYEQYDMDRTEFPVDDIAARGRDMALIPTDRARAFQDNLNALEEKWGLTRYARQPKGSKEEAEPKKVEPKAQDDGDGDGDAKEVKGTKRLPEKVPVDPLPDPQDTRDDEAGPEPVGEPVVAPEASAEPVPEAPAEIPPVTMNAGPGDTPIYPEGRPYEYRPYKYMTNEGEQTGYERIPASDTVTEPEPEKPVIEGDIYDYFSDRDGGVPSEGAVQEPVATAEQTEGRSEGEQALEDAIGEEEPVPEEPEPEPVPEEPAPEPVPETEEVQDMEETGPPPEEGRWNSVPSTANLTHPGRGNSPFNLAMNSIGTNLFNAKNSKYLVEPEDMRDAMLSDPKRAQNVMGSFKYRDMSGGPALRAVLNDNIYDMTNKLKAKGADVEGMDPKMVIAAYYENFPKAKDREMAIKTFNAMEFEDIYNARLRSDDQRLPPYEYQAPTFVDRSKPKETTEVGEDAKPFTLGETDMDEKDMMSPQKQQLMKLLEDYDMLGIDPEGMTAKEIFEAVNSSQSIPQDRLRHLRDQLGRINDGKKYQVWKDPAKQAKNPKAHRLDEDEKKALGDMQSAIGQKLLSQIGFEGGDVSEFLNRTAQEHDNGQFQNFVVNYNKLLKKAMSGQRTAEEFAKEVMDLYATNFPTGAIALDGPTPKPKD